MKTLILLPYFQINNETSKKRADLLIVEASINNDMGMLNAPEEIVNTLNGIGVKPAVNTMIKPCCSYCDCMERKRSSVNPGTLLKKKCAVAL